MLEQTVCLIFEIAFKIPVGQSDHKSLVSAKKVCLVCGQSKHQQVILIHAVEISSTQLILFKAALNEMKNVKVKQIYLQSAQSSLFLKFIIPTDNCRVCCFSCVVCSIRQQSLRAQQAFSKCGSIN